MSVDVERNLRYDVSTWVKDDVIYNELRTPTGQVIVSILDTKEKQIIDALISLGWTPPKGQL